MCQMPKIGNLEQFRFADKKMASVYIISVKLLPKFGNREGLFSKLKI